MPLNGSAGTVGHDWEGHKAAFLSWTAEYEALFYYQILEKHTYYVHSCVYIYFTIKCKQTKAIIRYMQWHIKDLVPLSWRAPSLMLFAESLSFLLHILLQGTLYCFFLLHSVTFFFFVFLSYMLKTLIFTPLSFLM